MVRNGFQWKAIAWAIQEIYWAYVPLIMLILVLALIGETSKLADMPDFLIVAAILYGESSSKISKIKKEAHEVTAIYSLGILAFAMSIVLWLFCVLFNNIENPNFISTINFKVYYVTCAVLWVGAFIYSIFVRVKIYENIPESSKALDFSRDIG